MLLGNEWNVALLVKRTVLPLSPPRAQRDVRWRTQARTFGRNGRGLFYFNSFTSINLPDFLYATAQTIFFPNPILNSLYCLRDTGDFDVFDKELEMNKDQVKGVAKDTAGKIQEAAGKLTGSKSQQAKGLEKQVSGKVQKGVGDVKEAAKDLKNHH